MASGDPADSLYKSAREALNRGQYRRAAELFREIGDRYPRSQYAPDAGYWEAFALYRIGATEDLRAALRALESQRVRFASAATQADVATLNARINGALATRGDVKRYEKVEDQAARGGTSCDKEDLAVRIEALKALSEMDPASTTSMLRRVISRRDLCSAGLRKQAVFLLGKQATADAASILSEVARGDTDPEVRSDAILWLSRMPGESAVATLEEILRTADDERMQRAAVRALTTNGSPRARQAVRSLLERADAPERLRLEVLGSFDPERATPEDAAYLRALYGKQESARMKERIIGAVARFGGAENEQWLTALTRNANEPMELRVAAFSRVTRSSTFPITELVRLYDTVAEREMRDQLIAAYARRKEPEATDKLLDIVRTGTDPQLRRTAISALTRKNDPRTQKLLLEIIDK